MRFHLNGYTMKFSLQTPSGKLFKQSVDTFATTRRYHHFRTLGRGIQHTVQPIRTPAKDKQTLHSKSAKVVSRKRKMRSKIISSHCENWLHLFFFFLVLRNCDDQGSRQESLILSWGSLPGWLRLYTLTRKKLFYAHWK